MKRTRFPDQDGLTEIQRLLIRIRKLQLRGETDRAKRLDKKVARLQRIEINKRKRK